MWRSGAWELVAGGEEVEGRDHGKFYKGKLEQGGQRKEPMEYVTLRENTRHLLWELNHHVSNFS